MKRMSIVYVLAAATLLWGCGGGGGQEQNTVSGTLEAATGYQVPQSGKVMIFWTVSSGSPDYVYKFGECASQGNSFRLEFPANPPDEAINADGIGVGMIVLLTSESTVPDGIISAEPQGVLGIAGQYAVIFKKADATAEYREWITDFPSGYSCGKCVPAQGEEIFDSFEPVECNKIKITIDDLETIEVCNWT